MKDLANEVKALMDKLANSTGDDAEDIATFTALQEKFTEFRNRLTKKMKYSSPTKARILRLQIVALDNQIAQYKQHFSKYQNSWEEEKRVIAEHEQKMDELFEDLDTQLEKMYIIAKHQMPKEFFEELQAKMFANITLEMRDEFLKRIAFLEETRLADILAGK